LSAAVIVAPTAASAMNPTQNDQTKEKTTLTTSTPQHNDMVISSAKEATQKNPETILTEAGQYLINEDPTEAQQDSVYQSVVNAVQNQPEYASWGLELVSSLRDRLSPSGLCQNFEYIQKIAAANPNIAHKAVKSINDGLQYLEYKDRPYEQALASIVQIRTDAILYVEDFEREHSQDTASKDKFLMSLYEKGQKTEPEDIGPIITTELELRRSQGYLSQKTLKKYGFLAYKFLYENMQTRWYPGDTGNAEQYLKTLKTALSQKEPEELIKYMRVWLPEPGGEKKAISNAQRAYEDFSAGKWISDKEKAISMLHQDVKEFQIFMQRDKEHSIVPTGRPSNKPMTHLDSAREGRIHLQQISQRNQSR
jgi:hypothetical protein